MSLQEFVQKHKQYFWSTNDLKSLSNEVIVENILNFGSFEDVKEMFEIIGLKESARIFKKQINQKRNNYNPKIANYFKLYFKKYAF